MFSQCLCGFSPGPPTSSHRQRRLMTGGSKCSVGVKASVCDGVSLYVIPAKSWRLIFSPGGELGEAPAGPTWHWKIGGMLLLIGSDYIHENIHTHFNLPDEQSGQSGLQSQQDDASGLLMSTLTCTLEAVVQPLSPF